MTAQLTAVQFERFMTSGRTGPGLFGCETSDGAFVGEYVVKLRGTVGDSGLCNELLATKLAGHFSLPTAEAAIVTIDPTLAELIAALEPSRASAIRQSVGPNFGTRYVHGASPWPIDKSIPAVLIRQAGEIFAFDALIQNADRRYGNPNLLVVRDGLVIFDHESAFSFLLALIATATPWDLDDQRYLEQHVFYRTLKGRELDLGDFDAALRVLSPGAIAALPTDVPPEWNNESVLRIRRHPLAVVEHADEFLASVRRFLA